MASNPYGRTASSVKKVAKATGRSRPNHGRTVSAVKKSAKATGRNGRTVARGVANQGRLKAAANKSRAKAGVRKATSTSGIRKATSGAKVTIKKRTTASADWKGKVSLPPKGTGSGTTTRNVITFRR